MARYERSNGIMYRYVHQPYPKFQPVNVVLQLVNFDGSPFWLSLDRALDRVWHWKSKVIWLDLKVAPPPFQKGFNYWCLNLFHIYQSGLHFFSPCTFFNFKVCYLLIYSQNFYLRTQFQFIWRIWYLKINLWYCSCGESDPLKPRLCLRSIRASNPLTYWSIHSYRTCSLFMSVRRI